MATQPSRHSGEKPTGRLAGISVHAPVAPDMAAAEYCVYGDGCYGLGVQVPFHNEQRHAVMLTHLFLEAEVPPDRLEDLWVSTAVRGLSDPADQQAYVRARLLEPGQEVPYYLEARFKPRSENQRPLRGRAATETAFGRLRSLGRLRLNLHWQVIDRQQQRWCWCALDLDLVTPRSRSLARAHGRLTAP